MMTLVVFEGLYGFVLYGNPNWYFCLFFLFFRFMVTPLAKKPKFIDNSKVVYVVNQLICLFLLCNCSLRFRFTKFQTKPYNLNNDPTAAPINAFYMTCTYCCSMLLRLLMTAVPTKTESLNLRNRATIMLHIDN